jgi:hypothetical protein
MLWQRHYPNTGCDAVERVGDLHRVAPTCLIIVGEDNATRAT